MTTISYPKQLSSFPLRGLCHPETAPGENLCLLFFLPREIRVIKFSDNDGLIKRPLWYRNVSSGIAKPCSLEHPRRGQAGDH